MNIGHEQIALVTILLVVIVLYNLVDRNLLITQSSSPVEYIQPGQSDHPNPAHGSDLHVHGHSMDQGISGSAAPDTVVRGRAGTDFLPEHLRHVDQHNEELIKYIKDHWIFPPSSEALNLANHTRIHYSQYGQSPWIDVVLGNKSNGYFIDCGAADGELFSNSLFFERQRNWTGILIEANPDFFDTLLSKNRKAYKLNVCLSPFETPVVLNFSLANIMSGMTEYRTKDLPGIPISSIMPVQCLPLLSILRATGIKHVDYFSLDVEGAELDILKTIPFDELDIGLFGIETFLLVDDSKHTLTKAKVAAVGEMLGEHNYTKLSPPFSIDTMMQKQTK